MNIKANKWLKETAEIRALMSRAKPGTLVTYAELSDLLNMTIKSQSVPLRRALVEMEREGIVFSNVSTLGYRRTGSVTNATTETPKYRRKAFRAAKRAARKGSAVVDSELSPSLRVTHWANMAALATVSHDLHGNSIRAKQKSTKESTTLKQALKAISEESERHTAS